MSNGSGGDSSEINQSSEQADVEAGSNTAPDVSGWYTRPERFIGHLDRAAAKVKIPWSLRKVIWAVENRLSMYWVRDHYRAQLDETHAKFYTLPAGEKVRWPVFWITEAFTPSTLDSLLNGIERAGWSRSQLRRNSDVSEWIAEMRGHGAGVSGWMHLTTVVPKGARSGFTDAVNSVLPKGIKRVSVHLHQPSPALTLIRAAFVLDETEAMAVDRKLKEKTKPRINRASGKSRRNAIDTHHAKRADLKDLFEDHHAEAQRWLARRVPGVFWNTPPRQPSVVDLLVTQVREPGQGVGEGFADYYLDELDIASGYNAWRATDAQGLYFHTKSGFTLPKYGYLLSGRFADILSDDDFRRMADGRTIDNIVWRLNAYWIDGLASRLVLTDLLRLFEQSQAKTRDLANKIHGRSAVRSSLRLRDQLFGFSLDVIAVTQDIEQLTVDERGYEWEVMEFEQRKRDKTGLVHVTKLLNAMRESQQSASRRIAEQDRQLREVLQTGASLSAAAADIRLQRWAVIVAVLSTVIAVGAVVVSVAIADPKWLP